MNQLEQTRGLARWLRNKLRLEMLLQGLIGSAVSALAVAILGLMAGLASALILTSAGDPLESAFFTGLQTQGRDWDIFGASFLFILSVAFFGAHKIRQRIDYSAIRPELARNIDHHLFDAAADLGGEIFLAAPQLIVRAGECFGKIARLARIDVPQVAEIILWLLDRGHKASVEEISAAFPKVNVVAVLPQFRDIPGVIWLLPRRGVILLSKELRDELSDFLGRRRPVREEPQPEYSNYSSRSDVPPDEPPPEPPRFRPEVLQWYEALGLPAFASIQDVKKRYRQLAKKYHPDAVSGRSGTRLAHSDEAMKRINFAYHEILKSANHG